MRGEVPEWLNGAVSKTVVRASVPRVRIPLSPPVPDITVTIDNVSRELIKHLDAAVESAEKIEITYRPYLSNDLSGPQMDPPITLILSEVEADVSRVVGRARMLDIGNKSFPSETYTATRFPGLTR